MKFDYNSLNYAGTENYRSTRRPEIVYPGTETVEWYGFKRHNFEIDGHKGFIVEPHNPAPGLPWSWCLQWAESFVPRTPALKLLERGFHHVYMDVFSTYLNPEGLAVLEKFYELLMSLGFYHQAALIGMSYGGLFAFRWAAEHPESVAAIYADAPVCDLGFGASQQSSLQDFFKQESEKRAAAYGTTVEALGNHPLSPLNNYQPIADAKIPVFCIRSGQDQSVIPEKNIDIFAERLRNAGGIIEILDRPLYGHHPHGLDDPSPLVDFILKNYPF